LFGDRTPCDDADPGPGPRLESRFARSVLDIYSLNKVRLVGVFDAAAGGHVLLQPQLQADIQDDEATRGRRARRTKSW